MLAVSKGIRQLGSCDFRVTCKVAGSKGVRVRHYGEERIDFATYKKSKSLFDIFSKKEPSLDPEFVKMLRCPITRNPLRYDEAENELIEEENGIVYAVIDGVPILTPSAAKSLHRYVETDTSQEK